MTVSARSASRCRTCKHPERPRVELMLARRVGLRYIAAQFGLSLQTLARHRKRHMPAGLIAALALDAPSANPLELERLRKDRAEGLLQRAVAAEGRILAAIGQAEQDGDLVALARLWARWQEGWAAEARLHGQLVAHGPSTVTNNISIGPQFFAVYGTILQALAPFPEARRAVAASLDAMRSKPDREPGAHEYVD